MTIEAPQRPTIAVGETRVFKVDMRGRLDGTEVLNGTPTAVELTTTDLTIASVAVSTAALTILGATVPIGQALTFTVSGQLAGEAYGVLCTSTTDAGQTIRGIVRFNAEAAS